MSDRLRLVSYNLLEGLRPIAPIAGERRQLDRERADAARRVVNDLDPDMLVLNEALYSRQYRGHMVDYARLFGFPYQSAALYDDAWGNAILSRCPILRSHEMRTEDRGVPEESTLRARGYVAHWIREDQAQGIPIC